MTEQKTDDRFLKWCNDRPIFNVFTYYTVTNKQIKTHKIAKY